MKIKLVSPQDQIEYIRYARTETILALGGTPQPVMVEPAPTARYVLAFEDSAHEEQPVGMAEAVMLKDMFGSYDEYPFSSRFEISRFCPFEHLASIRTIFVEAEYRGKHPLFLQLTGATTKLFQTYGATHSICSTSAADTYLNKLYQRLGGKRLGTIPPCEGFDCETCFYILDLEKIISHRAYQRYLRSVEVELDAELPHCAVC